MPTDKKCDGLDLPRMSHDSCPTCGHKGGAVVHRGSDDRFDCPGVFTVRACSRCGTGYLADPVAEEYLRELYRRYYETHSVDKKLSALAILVRKYGVFRWLCGIHDAVCEARPGDSVLDVGCGRGAMIAMATALGADWTGLDIDPKNCEAVRALGYTCFNERLEDLHAVTDARFSLVVLSHVLEHAYDPLGMLTGAGRLLAPGGRVSVSIPNFGSRFRPRTGPLWIHWHVPYHLTHWTTRSFRLLCRRAGLRVGRMWTTTPTGWRIYQRSMCRQEEIPGRTILLRLWYMLADRWSDTFDKNGDAICAVLRPAR